MLCLVSAIALTTIACSSDSSSEEEGGSTFVLKAGKPQWQVDMSGNEPLPTWQDPPQSESYMYLIVKLQDELVPYSTDDDRMATFRGDECCSIVSHRSVHNNGSIYFILKIHGNATKEDLLTLKYYNGGLKQLFELNREIPFIADLSYGDVTDFVPPLTTGCKKYPYYTYFATDELSLPAETTDDDLIGAFIGGECRGVCKPGEVLTVLGLQNGETAELRFYSAAKGGVYNLKQTVTIKDVETPQESRQLRVVVGENPLQGEAAEARTRADASIETSTLTSFSMNYQGDKYDFTKTGGKWNTHTWPGGVGDDTEIDFYAYNAGTFQYNNGNPYVVFTTEESASSQKDFLVATHKSIKYNDCNGLVSLRFDHATAAVMFQICKTNTISSYTVKVKKVVLKKVIKEGNYFYGSGWSLGSTTTDFTLYDTEGEELSTAYKVLPCEWLFLIPQTKEGITLDITYNIGSGADKQNTIAIGTDSWVAGASYIVNIKVGTSFLKQQAS